MKNLIVEKIGGMFWVVSPAFESEHADENGNFNRNSEIMSKPYKTEKGANKEMNKRNK